MNLKSHFFFIKIHSTLRTINTKTNRYAQSTLSLMNFDLKLIKKKSDKSSLLNLLAKPLHINLILFKRNHTFITDILLTEVFLLKSPIK